MVNGELERDKKDRITGWEGIEKGPDVLETSDAEDNESSISENDIEYFKKNPKELSDLVADLVKLRGGADAIKEGATWDKDMRAYVGADGLPRDWITNYKRLTMMKVMLRRRWAALRLFRLQRLMLPRRLLRPRLKWWK